MNLQQPNSFRTGPDERGRFGDFGGRFVSETLMPLILDLEAEYEKAKTDPSFWAEMDDLWKHYVGRPSPLSDAPHAIRHAPHPPAPRGFAISMIFARANAHGASSSVTAGQSSSECVPASANGSEIGRSWLPPMPCWKTMLHPFTRSRRGATGPLTESHDDSAEPERGATWNDCGPATWRCCPWTRRTARCRSSPGRLGHPLSRAGHSCGWG